MPLQRVLTVHLMQFQSRKLCITRSIRIVFGRTDGDLMETMAGREICFIQLSLVMLFSEIPFAESNYSAFLLLLLLLPLLLLPGPFPQK